MASIPGSAQVVLSSVWGVQGFQCQAACQVVHLNMKKHQRGMHVGKTWLWFMVEVVPYLPSFKMFSAELVAVHSRHCVIATCFHKAYLSFDDPANVIGGWLTFPRLNASTYINYPM